jgi:cation transport ATPase
VLNRLKLLLVLVSAAGLAAGFLAPFIGMAAWQPAAWQLAAMIVLVFLVKDIFVSLRQGEFGLDIVAALSMSAALYFGETLAAAVVALMYSGGELLEDFAEACTGRPYPGAPRRDRPCRWQGGERESAP